MYSRHAGFPAVMNASLPSSCQHLVDLVLSDLQKDTLPASTALFSAEALDPTPTDLCVQPYRETTVVCPLASEPTEPLLGTYQAGHKLEIPGSRCHNPLSTKQKLAIKCTKPASIYQTAKH